MSYQKSAYYNFTLTRHSAVRACFPCRLSPCAPRLLCPSPLRDGTGAGPGEGRPLAGSGRRPPAGSRQGLGPEYGVALEPERRPTPWGPSSPGSPGRRSDRLPLGPGPPSESRPAGGRSAWACESVKASRPPEVPLGRPASVRLRSESDTHKPGLPSPSAGPGWAARAGRARGPGERHGSEMAPPALGRRFNDARRPWPRLPPGPRSGGVRLLSDGRSTTRQADGARGRYQAGA